MYFVLYQSYKVEKSFYKINLKKKDNRTVKIKSA